MFILKSDSIFEDCNCILWCYGVSEATGALKKKKLNLSGYEVRTDLVIKTRLFSKQYLSVVLRTK